MKSENRVHNWYLFKLFIPQPGPVGTSMPISRGVTECAEAELEKSAFMFWVGQMANLYPAAPRLHWCSWRRGVANRPRLKGKDKGAPWRSHAFALGGPEESTRQQSTRHMDPWCVRPQNRQLPLGPRLWRESQQSMATLSIITLVQ